MKKKIIMYIILIVLFAFFGTLEAIMYRHTGVINSDIAAAKLIFGFMTLIVVYIDADSGFDSEEEEV